MLKKIKKNKLESKFILSHPIAGSEKSGFLNSSEDLFKDKISIISKHNGLAINTLKKCKELWFELGSETHNVCLLYTSPSPRDATLSRMPSSA